MTGSTPELAFRPLTAGNWDDIERLFGKRGASSGCWCMLWRRSPAAFRAGKGDGNRAAMRRLAETGPLPGILAYDGELAIGWRARAC